MTAKKSNNKKSISKSTINSTKTSDNKTNVPKIETLNVDIKEKVSQGWIHINSMIEVLGIKKEVTENMLREHISKLETEKGIIIAKKLFSTIEKVENPPKTISEAYSQFVELEILVRNYS